jgi:hypothetical protein
MALGLTRPRTEISTRKCFLGVKRGDPRHLTTMETSTACCGDRFTFFSFNNFILHQAIVDGKMEEAPVCSNRGVVGVVSW